MHRKLLLLPVLFLWALLLPAQDLSIKDSLSGRFFRANFPDQSKSLDFLTIDTSFSYRNLTFYNFSNPKGFVILRDLNSTFDVTGYSYGEHFSFEVDTTGFLLNLVASMADQANVPGYAPAKVPANLKTGRYAVEPLVRTAWNQGWPYNVLCPADPDVITDDNRSVVGCVAVAMAQIIRYYDKWSKFEIYYSYTHPVFGTLTCNSGHYNWSQMENACYSVNYEVASLLYDCGVLVNMNYDRSGSGANSADAASRLRQIYGNGYLNTTLASEEEFFHNISNYQPIYATYPGHAFVCDGFDGGSFYHFNLGWGGSSNGYYALSNVVSHALTSAIFNIFPGLPEMPPRKLQKSPVSGNTVQFSWTGPDQDRSTLTGYKIYLDDIYLADSQDTTFVHECVPGDHYLKVSAQFQSGESRWIGPVSYFFGGNPVTIPDATLRRALNIAAGVPTSQAGSHVPTEGELTRISRLNVSNATDLTGIGHCINLKQLTLYSAVTTRTLDMEQIRPCAGLANLTIENYRISNPSALADLKKLSDLRLTKNQLSNTGFLKALTLITRLEITGNTIEDISFLNDMQRVERLVMKNCNISSDFSTLDNAYGLRYVDISNNKITSLNWISPNGSLIYLNAASNKLSGTVQLSGLPVIRTIDLSGNTITEVQLTGAPLVESVNISYNSITDIQQFITDNPDLATLTAHHNRIASIPAVSNRLNRLEIQNNLIREITKIGRFTLLTYLDLSNNLIVDLTGITDGDYHKRLSSLNLRNNPISKQSFQEIIPVIKNSGIPANLPTQFFAGSPCYLNPANGMPLLNKSIRFTWEGDYNSEGYAYQVFLSRESGPYTEIASGLATRELEYDLTDLGKYNWYVVSQKDSSWYQSRIEAFKIMKGFSIPFLDDFEIYTATSQLSSQSPFWRIYGPVQDPAKDGTVSNSKAFEGAQSIKLAGTADIWFPVSEYLTGSCQAEFRIMVEKSRKAFAQVILSDGTKISLYFYSEGIVEIYHNTTKFKHLTYKPREWLNVSVNFATPSDFRIEIDNQMASEVKAGNSSAPGISGIRFGTTDGPGYHQSLPFVFYVDNFSILSGTSLSVGENAWPEEFPARVAGTDGLIRVMDISSEIRNILILSTDGRRLYEGICQNPGARLPDLSVPVPENLCIVILRDSGGRSFYRKVVAK